MHEATGGWTAPLLVVLGAIVLLGVAGTVSAGLTGPLTGENAVRSSLAQVRARAAGRA